MAHAGGRTRIGERAWSRFHAVQEIVPSSAWSEDSKGHYLLIFLPGFRKEEVKIQVDDSGKLMVRGERIVNNDKLMYFEQNFSLPDNADIDNIAGHFDDEILNITVPKQIIEEKEESESRSGNENKSESENTDRVKEENVQEEFKSDEEVIEDSKQQTEHDHGHHFEKKKKRGKNSSVDDFPKEMIEKWGKEGNQLDKAIEILKKNKNIVIIALIAFSLGVLTTRRFDSYGQ